MNLLDSRESPGFRTVSERFIAALIRACLLLGLPSTGRAAICNWNDGCRTWMLKVLGETVNTTCVEQHVLVKQIE
jgi:hypothetical protein